MDDAIPFEFERKFLVAELPQSAIDHGGRQIIIQAYVFAEAGYAVRVRIAFRDMVLDTPPFSPLSDELGAYERRLLKDLIAKNPGAAIATLAVKSPAVSGERFEFETQLDTDVAVQIIARSGRIVAKTRYSIWMGQDGWEFDVFAGQNQGLIIAEIERATPVIDLVIPDFCRAEVTGDPRFSNDYLAKEPWQRWDVHYRNGLN